MEEKTKLILKAYLSLSLAEQEAFQNAAREYSSKNIIEKGTFSEALNKSLGPIMGAKCAVCGK